MTAVAMDEDTLSIDWSSSLAAPDVDGMIRDLNDIAVIREALKQWEAELTELVAFAVGSNTVEVDGVRYKVKRSTDRKQWDRRGLVRAVLDSRRPVDSETGVFHDSDSGLLFIDGETISTSPDLSRIGDVWNLGAPRVTALRERSIDPDEFCESSPGRVSVVPA